MSSMDSDATSILRNHALRHRITAMRYISPPLTPALRRPYGAASTATGSQQSRHANIIPLAPREEGYPQSTNFLYNRRADTCPKHTNGTPHP
jgi:hypothetical protein